MPRYVIAIDQGTTGSTILILDETLKIIAKVNQEFPQSYPKPGWVEHDPEEIWGSVLVALKKALELSKIDPNQIAAIGITNQRETSLIWERATGRAIHPALVWQDRRTADLCRQMKSQGLEPLFRERTGLVLDPYFSGTKIRWLLDNIAGARAAANQA